MSIIRNRPPTCACLQVYVEILDFFISWLKARRRDSGDCWDNQGVTAGKDRWDENQGLAISRVFKVFRTGLLSPPILGRQTGCQVGLSRKQIVREAREGAAEPHGARARGKEKKKVGIGGID